MALITIAQVKKELANVQRGGDFDDEMLTNIVNGVWALFCTLTDRTWESGTFTEYHTVRNVHQKILPLRELACSAITTIHNDVDGWEYAAGDLVAAAGYTFDAEEGLIYFKTALAVGIYRSVKVVYAAGYTSVTVPYDIKQILIRQSAHWYKQAKGFAGYERLETTLDEFNLLTLNQKYRRKFWHEDM